jgi:hypothetical protein
MNAFRLSLPSGFLRPGRRWIALVSASMLFHAIALQWAAGNLRFQLPDTPKDSVIAARLQAPQTRAALPSADTSRGTKKPRRSPVRKKIKPPEAGNSSLMPQDAVAKSPEPAVPAPEVEPASATENPPSSEPVPAMADMSEPHHKIVPLPPAGMEYEVQWLRRDKDPVYGNGRITWHHDNHGYVINGEAGALFFTFLNFKSEGMIDEFGVSPVLYSEKRWRKAETNTHFHRERNTISFSASEKSYPRRGGEQDRASIVWQLAGIGRGDPAVFAPDNEIDIMVAGVRDAESWKFRVIGLEDMDLPIGSVSAWHVQRLPRAGSFEQKLDLWFMPEREWYPARIRYTETSGDYLEMNLSSISRSN